MSRFHLSSDESVHEAARELCSAAELTKAGEVTNKGINISTYEKRTIENTNLTVFENGGFVAVTGTLIINGKMGGEALESVYDTFTNGGAAAVRDQAFGHYAVIVGKGDQVTVFGDPNGVYEIYYTTQNDWVVSNSLHLCSSTLSEPTVRKHELLVKALEVSEVTDSTIFTDVKRLEGSELLSIDTSEDEISVEPMSRPQAGWEYQDESIETVVEDYSERVMSVFADITAATSDIGIQATGGLDSRSVLAGILQQETNPAILYAVGNSPLTNTKDNDLDVARKYAQEFNLDFRQLDWGGSLPTDRSKWTALFRKYGYRYNTYGATENFYDSLASSAVPELLMSGYAFGTVSNHYYWELTSSMPITLREIVENHFTYVQKFSDDQFGRKDKYIEQLYTDCQTALNRHGLQVNPGEELPLETFVTVIQLLNGRPQSAYVNIANEFSFHLAPYATFELSRPMLDFPPKHRRGERIRVKLLEELYPNVLNIPMFSGTAQAKITEDSELVFPKSPSDRLVDFVSRNLPQPLLSQIRPIYQHLNSGPVGTETYNELKRSYQSRIQDSELTAEDFDLESYTGDIRLPARLVHYVHGIEEVGYGSVVDR
ncbi:hypothetical protein [Halorubrum distributum]|uniref:hypothetical protein n=1 Tax=Halorubrum distributum TaxID=29283 RepID=UPI000AEAF421|nr:hypothetical protein [Halorubrum litoreum]